MEEVAATPTLERTPRYDRCERPGGWLLISLLLACVQPFFFGIVYLPGIACGLLAGCAMFLSFLYSVGKPDKAGRFFPNLFWLMIWVSVQPRELDFLPHLMVGLQYGSLMMFVYLWLCYLARETVARRATANKPVKPKKGPTHA